jgi:hypothetical protein
LLPLTGLADRNSGAAFSTVLVASAGMFGVFLFLTYYLQQTLGYSPVASGLAFLPMVGALMVTAQLTTNVPLPRIDPKVVVPIGLLLATVGMAWLTRLDLQSTYAVHVLPPLLATGAGLGWRCRRRPAGPGRRGAARLPHRVLVGGGLLRLRRGPLGAALPPQGRRRLRAGRPHDCAHRAPRSEHLTTVRTCRSVSQDRWEKPACSTWPP